MSGERFAAKPARFGSAIVGREARVRTYRSRPLGTLGQHLVCGVSEEDGYMASGQQKQATTLSSEAAELSLQDWHMQQDLEAIPLPQAAPFSPTRKRMPLAHNRGRCVAS